MAAPLPVCAARTKRQTKSAWGFSARVRGPRLANFCVLAVRWWRVWVPEQPVFARCGTWRAENSAFPGPRGPARALEGAKETAHWPKSHSSRRERATVRRAYVGPSRKGAAVADVLIPATRLLRILTPAAVDVDGPSRRARRGRRRRTARGAAPPRASPLLVVGPAVRRPAMDSSGVAAVRTARREFGARPRKGRKLRAAP